MVSRDRLLAGSNSTNDLRCQHEGGPTEGGSGGGGACPLGGGGREEVAPATGARAYNLHSVARLKRKKKTQPPPRAMHRAAQYAS